MTENKRKDENLKKNVNLDGVDETCIPENREYKDGPFDPKNLPLDGTYKEHKDPKREDTATDVYYKTECKLPDSKVAIPTEDSVEEAKEWVDDANRR